MTTGRINQVASLSRCVRVWRARISFWRMRDPEESRGSRGYGGIPVSMVPLRSRTESSLSGAVLHSRLPLRRQHRGVCVRGHREDLCVGQTGRKPCVPTRISSARHWHVAMPLADALRHSGGSQGTPGANSPGESCTPRKDPSAREGLPREPRKVFGRGYLTCSRKLTKTLLRFASSLRHHCPLHIRRKFETPLRSSVVRERAPPPLPPVWELLPGFGFAKTVTQRHGSPTGKTKVAASRFTGCRSGT